MAQQLFFSRDTKVYIKKGTTVWDLPVLDGFSFSQATNSSEITLAEMEATGGASRRGRKQFNDSLAPAEWSFTTYVRPFKSAGSGTGAADSSAKVHAIEEVLWALFSGPATYASNAFTNQTVHDATDLDIDFSESNKATLGTADIFFVLGDANRKVYKLKDCVVNEASLDFDIDGIASINWSGMSSEIVDMTARTITQAAIPAHNATVADGSVVSAPSTSHPGGDVWLDSDDGHRLHTILTVPGSGNTTATTNVYEATNSTTNFIRNRLTQLSVIPTTQNPTGDGSNELESAYDLTLTGGNITMSNNVSFITPEELGLVNIPIGHVTGTRSVSGSMTCYLSKDTSATDNSADLWEDLKSITSVVTNSFGLIFKIGGATSNTARLEVNMPTCHLEIPTHSIEDVISLETNFNALPSTIDGTNEVTLKYFPKV
tara:strand:+ start:2719 stop:4011 length:1293 start_codon:yes stop_codon:yes gene_type:complete